MTQEIEIEFKNLITVEEYRRLLHAYSFPQEGKKQINYYFETPDQDLKKHGCALRIREKSDTYTLTLKEPHPNGLLETHDKIEAETCQKWIHGRITPQPFTSKQLDRLGIQPENLKYMGNLETIRREISFKGTLLVLDISTYNHHMDYEFELEASNESLGSQLFESILTEQKIPKRNTPNKIKRFYKTLHD